MGYASRARERGEQMAKSGQIEILTKNDGIIRGRCIAYEIGMTAVVVLWEPKKEVYPAVKDEKEIQIPFYGPPIQQLFPIDQLRTVNFVDDQHAEQSRIQAQAAFEAAGVEIPEIFRS